ncbi:MAG: hypothetical protein CFE28_05725 [Alphaproteobacteria bacterium PA2]|jgi:UrcA family protein|nr:MAG: hypothetical protein CFE28_05725 [Alphaproteobacteria bacterium PA2]
MPKTLQTLTAIASLAMAALPTLALTNSAHASAYAIKVSDLDLSDANGQSILQARVNTVAANLCSDLGAPAGTRIENRAACESAVRAEAMEKLATLTTTNAGSR